MNLLDDLDIEPDNTFLLKSKKVMWVSIVLSLVIIILISFSDQNPFIDDEYTIMAGLIGITLVPISLVGLFFSIKSSRKTPSFLQIIFYSVFFLITLLLSLIFIYSNAYLINL